MTVLFADVTDVMDCGGQSHLEEMAEEEVKVQTMQRTLFWQDKGAIDN
jgi:hypothetical protein